MQADSGRRGRRPIEKNYRYFLQAIFGTSRTPSPTKILWIISKSIYFFASHFRDVADAVPYKKIIHHRKIILIFCKPIRDVCASWTRRASQGRHSLQKDNANIIRNKKIVPYCQFLQTSIQPIAPEYFSNSTIDNRITL